MSDAANKQVNRRSITDDWKVPHAPLSLSAVVVGDIREQLLRTSQELEEVSAIATVLGDLAWAAEMDTEKVRKVADAIARINDRAVADIGSLLEVLEEQLARPLASEPKKPKGGK